MGKIVNNNTYYEGILSFEKTTFEEKLYILVKLLDSKIKMKRSSLYYIFTLNLSINQDLKKNFILPDLGGYNACRKTLEIDNSIIKTININPLKAGASGIIVQLALRTDEDYSHNYFLDSIDLITFIGINYNLTYNKICEIKYSKVVSMVYITYNSYLIKLVNIKLKVKLMEQI